jgi:asparagine synthase (glutamine-hydrolysing)
MSADTHHGGAAFPLDLLAGHVGAPHVQAAPAATVTSGAARAATQGADYRLDAAAATGRLLAAEADGAWLACVGAPYAGAAEPAAATLLRGLRAGREATLGGLGGQFALAWFEAGTRTLLLATDRFAGIPVYYEAAGGGLRFSTDLAALRDAGRERRIDPQALYDYLFFSVVPSGRGILAGVRKLPAASVLVWRDGRLDVARYWSPDFARSAADPAGLERATVDAIRAAVERVAGLPDLGCFLSGGLDSSTVCGLAARSRTEPTRAFTIGYDVPEFDESAYARVSARHFGLELSEHRIRSRDIAGCVGRVVNGFFEPFGNPSAVSAYLCAHFAHEAGVRNMLAGDGGDELFAGNERYQKQLLFNLYADLPGWLRGAAVDPVAALLARAPGPLPKLASYVRQARVPLPDRLYGYNLLVRNDPSAVLTREFLATVDVESPYRYARAIYGEPAAGDALDRMLYLDWTTTLTDNDLPKVNVACRLAGVAVHFPLLDPAVVDVSTRVPSGAKLTLRELRKFYKRAFRGILPREVLTKPKHGFGVPVGIWVNGDATLRERVHARLGALARRGIVRSELVADLLQRQQSEHASYYGALVWPLFALEEWLQGHGL